MLDASMARDGDETMQVLAKANRSMQDKDPQLAARWYENTKLGIIKTVLPGGKNADVARGYSHLRHGQGILELDEDRLHLGQLAAFDAELQVLRIGKVK
jgi:hypothetical protein